jgi:predicted amidohydrolase
MRVALGQTIGTAGNVSANLELMDRLATEAVTANADLLVLPELFLSGYNIGDMIDRLAEPTDGPASREIADIARRARVAIAYGSPERAADGIYNTVTLIDRQGDTVASYRKSHLWGDWERQRFLSGMAPTLFTFGGLRCAFMICYDLDFPEIVRKLALEGTELIVSISATTHPFHVVPRCVVPTRAYENRLFVLFANRTGHENGVDYVGESCVAAPDGSFLAKADAAPGLVLADITRADFAGFIAKNPYRGDLRPELY